MSAGYFCGTNNIFKKMQSHDWNLKNSLIKQNEPGSLNEVFVLKRVAKWTNFAYTIQIDTHTRINTGACRSARTLKPVYLRNYHKTTRLHLIAKHPITKTKLRKKLSTAPPDTKPKTTLWNKGNVHPRLLKSAAAPTTRGQRYAKTSCQMPINKCKKTDK